MALINVHPDYLQFQADKGTATPNVEQHYQGWLAYIVKRYSGEFWHALPRDVAKFVRQWKQSATYFSS
jgi:hypothetical protein